MGNQCCGSRADENGKEGDDVKPDLVQKEKKDKDGKKDKDDAASPKETEEVEDEEGEEADEKKSKKKDKKDKDGEDEEQADGGEPEKKKEKKKEKSEKAEEVVDYGMGKQEDESGSSDSSHDEGDRVLQIREKKKFFNSKKQLVKFMRRTCEKVDQFD